MPTYCIECSYEIVEGQDHRCPASLPCYPLVVLMLDDPLHFAHNGYRCAGDPECPCHEQEQVAAGKERNTTYQCSDGS